MSLQAWACGRDPLKEKNLAIVSKAQENREKLTHIRSRTGIESPSRPKALRLWQPSTTRCFGASVAGWAG
ncbi:hypothetical protein MPNT_120052 [Candidatus Methylacidithermus pantelleriae]|uniref:Uncharacterized protein n=1 Tax=Candidatus Methylacidithermus pantelleriae TaxID=2744239 RepID=A0A8J2FRN8_9BACT|nr:hypothetical protein MPNT_120052 [Candidatus Methylacidithermus pantelleriae]